MSNGGTSSAAQQEKKTVEDNEARNSVSWTCAACTFIHTGESKCNYLVCELCGSERAEGPSSCPKRPDSRAATSSTTSITRNNESNKNQSALIAPPSSPWGCLRAPSQKDIAGPRKRRKGLEEPPPMMDYIIVLDFEWTADNRRRMEPIAEITQFPSVALRLLEGGRDVEQKLDDECSCNIPIPHDLRSPPQRPSRRDAWCISIFDSFVKPTLNPVLTQFSIELTAITQDMVDTAPTIDQVIVKYMKWLRGIGLVDNDGNRIGNWTFATWGDVDLMSTLRLELQHKSIGLPPCFDRWINLKDDSMFKRHFGHEPRGGLRACVESVGASWEGRAHNGLVDSINTAKIVRCMVQTGFRFTRSTRGLDKDGLPFGLKKRNGEKTRVMQKGRDEN